jgi:hypothetical protein
MDDAKLANGPVKVRCAKCKEVFVVAPEEPVAPAVSEPVNEPVAPAEDTGFSFDSPSSDSTEFSFDEPPSVSAPKAAPEAHQGTADEFDWQSGFDPNTPEDGFQISSPTDSAAAVAQAPPATGDISLDNDFDFGDTALISAADSQVSAPESQPAAPPAEDFSLDFGEVSFGETPTTESAEQFSPDSESFSFDGGATSSGSEFSFSPGADSDNQGVTEARSASVAAESAENVNFGDFSFGEIESKGDSVGGGSVQPSAEPEFDGTYGDEAPPASITSRKKRGALFPLLVILGAVVLLIALIGSGVYFFSGPKAFSKVGLGFLVEWYGDKGAEEGAIVLKNVTASYVNNSAAGELFVVKGEAVNNYKKPRASVQIKVSVLGTGGTVMVTKSAYCGNSLSAEQLASLPAAKLDEIMNNQFGDSLANMGLKPGAAIPFVIAVSQVPQGATDYSVQVSGSTVAAQ